MKIRLPARVAYCYDRTMDFIACCLFPPPKKIGFTILGHDVTLIDIALVFYTLAIGGGLWWWSGYWLWFPATVAAMVIAAMMLEWFF
jgi:hypothetical protein